MDSPLVSAHSLVILLLTFLPRQELKDSCCVLLASFLDPDYVTTPWRTRWKSPAALSRFLNHGRWSLRDAIREIHCLLLTRLKPPSGRGRPPLLQVVLDLTSLAKSGHFSRYRRWLFPYHRDRGLHLVVLYLVLPNRARIPWSLRIYRGKRYASAPQLGIALLRALPPILSRRFQIQVLADAGFCSREFLQAVHDLHWPAVVGIGKQRLRRDGRTVGQLARPGQQCYLRNWPHPVWISWRLHQGPNGVWKKHYWLSTRPLSAAGINVWAARRWQIEGFFRVAKQRFSLGQCRQQYVRGLFTWLLLVWVAYLLTYWAALSTQPQAEWPDWVAAATLVLRTLFLPLLLTWLERRRRELEQWSLTHTVLDLPLGPSLCLLS
jgi:Transposase DDE domain